MKVLLKKKCDMDYKQWAIIVLALFMVGFDIFVYQPHAVDRAAKKYQQLSPQSQSQNQNFELRWIDNNENNTLSLEYRRNSEEWRLVNMITIGKPAKSGKFLRIGE